MDSPNNTVTSNLATTVEIEDQSDNSESSGSSLFKTQRVPSSPKRRQENPLRTFVHSPESVQARASSSDSYVEPRPLTLKAVFERFKERERKEKRKHKQTGRLKGGKNTKSLQIDKKQFQVKGPGFPFLESENGRNPLPWKKVLTFEQAVARGFSSYIENKYEYHLKESLKDVGKDLEKEEPDSQRYKYLDDDRSISPVEESTAEDEDTTLLEHSDEYDIKLVEDNYFIISCELPKKRKVNLDEENGEDTALLRK
ncbi:LOW QUALITY PROTEIN: TATA box-binding protein-associated factor RNA polymerase I subunit D-like [Dugong dugon]